jgi:hypothetical protein
MRKQYAKETASLLGLIKALIALPLSLVALPVVSIVLLILSIPLRVLALSLAIVAVAFFTGSIQTGLVVTAVVLIALMVGRRLVAREREPNLITSLMQDGTENILESFKYVKVSSSGEISVEARNGSDAKAAIKELRLLKKSFSLKKRTALDQQQMIRAGYTDYVRRRGSKWIGGRGLGRFIRRMQTANRDTTRSILARDLSPLEFEKQRLKNAMLQIDGLITQLQAMAV